MNILVTGGAGYIGSHSCVELLKSKHQIVIFDNFSNSHTNVLKRLEQIARRPFTALQGDIRDSQALELALRHYHCEAVIHFAGLKAVGESVEKPLDYYDNNLYGSLCLLQAMQRANVRKLVFSSSATVYGDPISLPIKEDHPLSATSPYGRTKLMIEEMLRDILRSDANWKIAILRYFNPVGAHDSGLIGEDPQGIPNNLMPFIAQVAVGRRDSLQVFGHDYPTLDGTGVRDYIHVVDLAIGHLKALEYLNRLETKGMVDTFNLGTGKGYSVLEVLKAFEKASGRHIPYHFVPRRSGDVAACYADPEKAERTLNWKAHYGLEKMCQDVWNWQEKNPMGYKDRIGEALSS